MGFEPVRVTGGLGLRKRERLSVTLRERNKGLRVPHEISGDHSCLAGSFPHLCEGKFSDPNRNNGCSQVRLTTRTVVVSQLEYCKG